VLTPGPASRLTRSTPPISTLIDVKQLENGILGLTYVPATR
jgi:hypothetical protein